MPLFDFKCDACNTVHKDKYVSPARTREIAICALNVHDLLFYKCECGAVARPLMTAPQQIHVMGYNAANGYATKENPKPLNMDGIRVHRIK